MKPTIWLLAFLLVALLPVQHAVAQSAETPDVQRQLDLLVATIIFADWSRRS